LFRGSPLSQPFRSSSAQTVVPTLILPKKCRAGLDFAVPVPSYSQDVAPNDFYLFGIVKHRLTERMGETLEDLKEKFSEKSFGRRIAGRISQLDGKITTRH
jgi:hypothetical protein